MEYELQDEIYIGIDRYCQLKNIGKTTFYNLKKNKQIPFKIVKLKGHHKKHFLVLKRDEIIFIDKNNRVLL